MVLPVIKISNNYSVSLSEVFTKDNFKKINNKTKGNWEDGSLSENFFIKSHLIFNNWKLLDNK